MGWFNPLDLRRNGSPRASYPKPARIGHETVTKLSDAESLFASSKVDSDSVRHLAIYRQIDFNFAASSQAVRHGNRLA
jgi:hypothetical protein